ncbi:hypothetical protein RN001_006451 [Aquatica leii]|uniref:Phosphomevalonate kinase n=1 Tax=Aquatica leii TaxID=1421715 RepID=A0AAN7Q4K6_9COLE|nr:hypothetical protein RN001_006451 [Aquatica leii]
MNRKILLISGKRKSGKDYISEKVLEIIGNEKGCIIRISEPIKSHYAKENNLDLSELMSDNKYKENYRLQMIIWSDQVRSRDPGYFCRAACENGAFKPIWIVSDIRRKTDIGWFKDTYKDQIKTVRIFADEETRKARGYIFTSGVDDGVSECGLDDYIDWDLCVTNNNSEECDESIQEILKLIS